MTEQPARLDDRIYGTFDGPEPSRSLPDLVLGLLAEQRATWPDLEQAYEALQHVRQRELPCRGFSVRLQHNPGRMTSSTARVDDNEISERPCFLCLHRLPEGQKGVLYRSDYLVLCNPAPVFPSHFTIVRVEHRPQAIADQIDTFLRLAADFGSGWTVLYNGPRCGASAPDHLHFQAIPAGRLPVERELAQEERLALVSRADGVPLYRVGRMGREVIMLEGDDPDTVKRALSGYIDDLKKHTLTREEPMLNCAGFHDAGTWRLAVFPRRKHRPDVFFKEGDERVVVSPAVVEMAGVVVTPVERDFTRLDASAVEAIYREVSLETDSS
jgi:hypothetical protein